VAKSSDPLEVVRTFTQSTPERLRAMADALLDIEEDNIPGDVVEVGVGRGGNIMLARMLAPSRECWLYDTFDGMTEPDPDLDVKVHGAPFRAIDKYNWKKARGLKWCIYPLEGVRQAFRDTHISMDRMHFIVGPVEETIQGKAPNQIALLRLDVDWHKPTKAAIERLYPLLSPSGFLIVDDYGHWRGCRQAVDEYFGEAVPPWEDVDYTCRVFRKC